jgi:hypothetical protein
VHEERETEDHRMTDRERTHHGSEAETSPYVAEASVEIVDGLHRRAHLPLGHSAEFGVHGPVSRMFKLEPERELPLPVDYIVAAAAG